MGLPHLIRETAPSFYVYYKYVDTREKTTGIVKRPIRFEIKHIRALSEESLPHASVNNMVFIPTGIAQIITGMANKIPFTLNKYKNNAQTAAITARRTKEIIYARGLLKSSFNGNLPKTKPVKSIVTALIQAPAVETVSLIKPRKVEAIVIFPPGLT